MISTRTYVQVVVSYSMMMMDNSNDQQEYCSSNDCHASLAGLLLMLGLDLILLLSIATINFNANSATSFHLYHWCDLLHYHLFLILIFFQQSAKKIIPKNLIMVACDDDS